MIRGPPCPYKGPGYSLISNSREPSFLTREVGAGDRKEEEMAYSGWRKFSSALLSAVALAAAFAAPATAAPGTARYPAGGSAFDGGAEGWEATEASCTVTILCTTSGGY